MKTNKSTFTAAALVGALSMTSAPALISDNFGAVQAGEARATTVSSRARPLFSSDPMRDMFPLAAFHSVKFKGITLVLQKSKKDAAKYPNEEIEGTLNHLFDKDKLYTQVLVVNDPEYKGKHSRIAVFSGGDMIVNGPLYALKKDLPYIVEYQKSYLSYDEKSRQKSLEMEGRKPKSLSSLGSLSNG